MPDLTQLHVTLFEIVMTYRDYPEDPGVIFERHRAGIESELWRRLSHQGAITVTLDTLEASPNAIIVRGTDDGSFEQIRDAISQKQLLPDGTRTPPDIIHSSLARYIKAVDLEQVRSVVATQQLRLVQTVTELEMIKVWRLPMDHETIKVYKLR